MVQDGPARQGEPRLRPEQTRVDLDGRVIFSSPQLEDRLSEVKHRSKCHACGRESSPGKKENKGQGKGFRPAGFLAGAGLAMAILACKIPMLFALSSNNDRDLLECYPTNVDKAPPGYDVVDTGALAGCADSKTPDAFVSKFGVTTHFRECNVVFTGVTSAAPIRAESEQELSMGMGGVGRTMRFKRLPDSTTPIRLSLDQFWTLVLVCGSRTTAPTSRSSTSLTSRWPAPAKGT